MIKSSFLQKRTRLIKGKQKCGLTRKLGEVEVGLRVWVAAIIFLFLLLLQIKPVNKTALTAETHLCIEDQMSIGCLRHASNFCLHALPNL